METPTSAAPATRPVARPIIPPVGSRRWPGLLVLALMGAFFLPLYVRHAVLASDPSTLNASARQQFWPLLRYYNDQLFHSDPIADYFVASFPVGFKAVYMTAGSLIDPRLLGRILTYVLLGITAFAVARAAMRIRGPAAGWGAAALCLGATLYLDRMTGGLPRAFAFPFLAVGMLALARGKPLLMAGVVALSAGFYPVVSVVTGLALAVWLLLFPAAMRGKAETWSFPRRLLTTAVAGALAIAFVLPTMLAVAQWGPTLGGASADEYPELTEGPYQSEDRSTGAFSLQALKNFAEAPLAGLGGEWNPGDTELQRSPRQIALMVLLALGVAGFALLVRPSPPARRVLLLPAAAIAAYLLAAMLAPWLYLPARYQLFPLAIAALVIVPSGIAHLATVVIKHRDQRRTQALVMFATVGLFVLIFAGYRYAPGESPVIRPGPLATAGLDTRPSEHGEAYRFIAALPPRSKIAGWPADLDGVQYFTGQGALATRDGHQTFHRDYADLMRKRVQAVIDALYDSSARSLVRLRDEFGATHIVISRDLYGPKPPDYFAPFDKYVKESHATLAGQKPAALREADRAAVYPPTRDADRTFANENWLILDLNRIRSE